TDDGMRAHHAIGADLAAAEDLDERLEQRVGANDRARIDYHSLGSLDRDAIEHEFVNLAGPQYAVYLRQLGPGIHAQHLRRLRREEAMHAQPPRHQAGDDVGEVILARRVVGTNAVQAIEQLGSLKTVHAGIDLGDGLLFRGRGFLLHDGLDL